MCGRFTLQAQPKALIDLFELDELPIELHPRYNIAPSQQVPVVALKSDKKRRGLAMLKWGLVPNWAQDAKRIYVNARSETVDTLSMFADSFADKRCLIAADGFYEWKAITTKNKQPYHFRMKDHSAFAFAAIWDVWDKQKPKLFTAALLTTEPNEVTKPIHDRMPVILPRESYAAWLADDTPPDVLKSLLKPYPAAAMEVFAVSKYVSKATNEGPECLTPTE